MAAPILAHRPGAAAWLADHTGSTPRRADMVRLRTSLSQVLTVELAAARESAAVGPDRILLAALGRAVARTLGSGTLAVRASVDGATPHTVDIECRSEPARTAADLLAACRPAQAGGSAVALSYRGTDTAVGGPQDGSLLELHARLDNAVLLLDWWYDARSFDTCTVQELAAQFPLALIEITSG